MTSDWLPNGTPIRLRNSGRRRLGPDGAVLGAGPQASPAANPSRGGQLRARYNRLARYFREALCGCRISLLTPPSAALRRRFDAARRLPDRCVSDTPAEIFLGKREKTLDSWYRNLIIRGSFAIL